ncbi:MAG: ATP-dependent endonuclease [Sphingopyxis sp.]|nr:MAG: ATP-dependent endonuclease [Sphingopyxis sp.]
MRISRVIIKNFRAIEQLDLALDQNTVLIGENGVGKSCVIKAIDKFFAKSVAIKSSDFNDGNTNEPITVSLTFSDFSQSEQETFGARIHNGSMSVTRKILHSAPPRENGKYFGLTPRHTPFQEIRDTEGAVPRRQAYNNLRGQEDYADLPDATNDGQVQAGLLEWEAAHPDRCELGEDDGQFFGFSNVGRGLLQRHISFVFVPAVRDAASDAADKSGTVAHQIIELLVKTVVERREDFRAWKAQAEIAYQQLVDPENLGELSELSGELSATLQTYYNESSIDLQWQPAGEFHASLPAADVLLTEKGHTGPVEGKGHGLQRAFVFTLLQHLAKALHNQPDGNEEDAEPDEDLGDHTLILAIEEPELYQHPTKQRHFSRILSELASGGLAGVIGSNQVLVCSHSPLFISMDRFADIRLARRALNEDGSRPLEVSFVSEQQVCDRLNDVLQLEGNNVYLPDLLAARLHILDPLVAEGFFANLAVLVEGAGDTAAVIAAANARNVDLEALGIAILPVGGKLNLARPLAIFELFGIPTYTIFDCDINLGADDRHPEANIAIQKFAGEAEPVECRTYVGDRFASFERDLERVLRDEFGEVFETELGKARHKYFLKNKRILKNPVVLSEVLRGCYQVDASSETFESIIDKIVELRAQH